MDSREKYTDVHIEDLVKESQCGNTEAFGDLYDYFFDGIYRYVFYKVSENMVEDIVGSVFMKAWENIQKYKKKTSFQSWLFRIAHNAIIDHYRTKKENVELKDTVQDLRSLYNPGLLTEKRLVSDLVRKAIDKLEKKYQQIVVLKFLNEMENNEIAEILKTTEANIRTLQFRALKKLKLIIEEMQNTDSVSQDISVFEPKKISI